MADVFSIALAIIGFYAAMQGQWLVSRALWPRWVRRATRRCGGSLMWPAIFGLVPSVVAGLVATLANQAGGPGQLIAVVILGVWWMIAGVGLAGLATHVGQRLSSPSDDDRPWRATIRGGVALEAAFLLPIIGWFGLFPLALVIGTGAALLGLRKGKEEATVPVDRERPAAEPVRPSSDRRLQEVLL